MRIAVLYLLFLWIALNSSTAQTVQIDSLSSLLEHEESDTAKINILNQLVMKYYWRNTDSASSFALRALAISNSINNARGIADSNYSLGFVLSKQGSLEEALILLDKSRRIAYENGFKDIEAKSFNTIGRIRIYQGNYPVALEFLQKALTISNSIDNKSLTANILNIIGGLYYDQENYQQALARWEQALTLRLELGDLLTASGSMNNVGLAHSELGNYEQALGFFLRALNNSDDKAFCSRIYPYSNIGNIYYQMDKLDSAEHYYNIVYAKLNYCKDPLSDIWTLRGLARVKVKRKQWQRAIRFYNQAKAIAEEKSMPLELQTLVKELADLYENQGNIALAYTYFKQYKALGDSLYNDQKSKAIGRLEASYEYEQEKREKDVELQLQALADARKRSQQLWIRNTFIGGFMVMLLIAGLIYRNYIRKHKANNELLALNDEIKTQQAQLLEQSLKLQELNNSLNTLNQNLEVTVAKRTEELSLKNVELEIKNQKLEEYAFMNAHKLRAPIATLLGLTELYNMKEVNEQERHDLIDKIRQSALKLDNVVKEIRDILIEG